MNKTDLVNVLAEKCELTKRDAENAVNAIFNEISAKLLAGEEVKVSGFGVFQVKERKARVGTIPGTNTKITIPAAKTIAFKASKSVKENLK